MKKHKPKKEIMPDSATWYGTWMQNARKIQQNDKNSTFSTHITFTAVLLVN